MLTREHAIIEYRKGSAIPDRLIRSRDRHYRALAERMLAVYRKGLGRSRSDLHRQIEHILGPEPQCPARRIRAFCKLLDDAGAYEIDRKGEVAALRLRIFREASRWHPLVRRPDGPFESAEETVKAGMAERMGVAWSKLDRQLYADVPAFQVLCSFEGFQGPEDLLARYNVAQVQASLYAAQRVVLDARGDFKTILRYAKLARLLLDIKKMGPSHFRIELAGPASVLHGTRRYGIQMARFLPALLTCKDWRLQAFLAAPWGGVARLRLSSEEGLKSHLPDPKEFDSKVEEKFATQFGVTRDGWRLSRETEVLHLGQHTFMPDFVFRHADGVEAPFEIVGFWTPEYLARKRETLRRFANRPIILAVHERLLKRRPRLGENIIAYKTVVRVDAVMAVLERFRTGRMAVENTKSMDPKIKSPPP